MTQLVSESSLVGSVLGEDSEDDAPAAPSPLARGLFEAAFEAHWRRGPIPTALDVLEHDLRPLGAWHSPHLPGAAIHGGTEVPLTWTRPLSRGEQARRYVVGFDKNSAYLGVLGGLELGVGEPEHARYSINLYPIARPGYWLVRCSWPPPETGWPDPLRRRLDSGEPRWVTTPTLELALELDYDVDVLESWTWPRHRRLLRPFGDRCRLARKRITAGACALWDETDPQSMDTAGAAYREATTMLKHVYGPVLGGFLARTVDRDRPERPPWYRPDWRHHVIAKARSNLWRNMTRWRALGLWPIGVYNDAFYVATDDTGHELAERFGIPTGAELSGYKIAPPARLADCVSPEGRLNWRRMFEARNE